MSKTTIHVAIFHDLPVIVDGLPYLLGKMDPEIKVKVATPFAQMASHATEVGGIDVVINGFPVREARRTIMDAFVAKMKFSKRIHYSDFSVHGRLANAVQWGADAYVSKAEPMTQLVRAIREVHAGNKTASEDLLRLQIVHDHLGLQGQLHLKQLLSPRELEVLRCIANGQGRAATAARLAISVRTVDRHRQSIMQKLSIHREIELAHYAFRHGLGDEFSP